MTSLSNTLGHSTVRNLKVRLIMIYENIYKCSNCPFFLSTENKNACAWFGMKMQAFRQFIPLYRLHLHTCPGAMSLITPSWKSAAGVYSVFTAFLVRFFETQNYLVVLDACRFQTEMGTEWMALGSSYKMIDRRPIQTKTIIWNVRQFSKLFFPATKYTCAEVIA